MNVGWTRSPKPLTEAQKARVQHVCSSTWVVHDRPRIAYTSPLENRLEADGWEYDILRAWYTRGAQDEALRWERLRTAHSRYLHRLPTNRRRKKKRCQDRRRARRKLRSGDSLLSMFNPCSR